MKKIKKHCILWDILNANKKEHTIQDAFRGQKRKKATSYWLWQCQ